MEVPAGVEKQKPTPEPNILIKISSFKNVLLLLYSLKSILPLKKRLRCGRIKIKL